MSKKYYYSVAYHELPELLSFLEDCDRRYKNLDLKIATTFTHLWMISNKDLYVPFEHSAMKYKRRELKGRPTPETRWTVRWTNYKDKLVYLKELSAKRELRKLLG